MSTRLLYLVSHPIQYQAPLLRRIAREPDIALRVVFESAVSSSGHFDPGFGRQIAWDIPLRDGYDNVDLGETDIRRELGNSDMLWVHGWQTRFLRRLAGQAAKQGKPVLMRGENWSGAMPDGNGLRGWVKRRYLREIFSNCRGFLCIGSMNRRYYSEHGVADDRLFDMPYAIDNSWFAEQAAAADITSLRRELGIPEGRQVLLFAGKFSQRKHPHTLLEAWQLADWQGNRPVLLFVGDGPLRAQLRAAGDDDVVVAGFRNQTELPAIYRLADIFVLASEREAWGLAINEAMACGTGVIASGDCGATHDLIDGTCGLVVPSGDAAALAAVLPKALADSARLGRGAAARIAGWDFEADVRGLKAAIGALR